MEALKTASLMGQYKVVKVLLAAKSDASSKEGNGALHMATHIGNTSLVNLLLEYHSDPSSGLAAAAFRNNVEFVKTLLNHKADGKSRRKALKEAARYGHQQIMQVLLKHGVDTSTPEADSALRLAVVNNRPREIQAQIVDQLERAGARRRTDLPFLALPGDPPKKEKNPLWGFPGSPFRRRAQTAGAELGRSQTPLGGSRPVSRALSSRAATPMLSWKSHSASHLLKGLHDKTETHPARRTWTGS